MTGKQTWGIVVGMLLGFTIMLTIAATNEGNARGPYQMQCDSGWVYILDTSSGEVVRTHMGQGWKDLGNGWFSRGKPSDPK